MERMHISICICSYQRPHLLRQLLDSLRDIETRGAFTYSIVVADNDPSESARHVVESVVVNLPVPLIYCTEARRSISHARNKTLENASGQLIAFIDDDEIPERDWLYNLFSTLVGQSVAGVLGPVRPQFEGTPPPWIVKGRFCHRREHATGFVLPWTECRTGNVLFKQKIISDCSPVFLPEFGNAGGDMNFFLRMMNLGHTFVWCNEAVVHEIVPASRCKRLFMLKRAFLRGGNVLKQPRGRYVGLLKSAVAVPIYGILLPFMQLRGHHHFMRYLVKWCDHLGRLLSLFGVRLVEQRPM